MGRSYLTVFICQAIAAAATLAALHWLALYVAPETYGTYALYQSVISAGALFFVSWPNAALLRFGREEWTTHGRIGATLAARALLFGLSLLVAVLLAWELDPWLRVVLHAGHSPFWWIAAGLLVTPGVELAIYIHQAIGHTEMYGYSPLIIRGGFLTGVVLIPFIGGRLNWTYLAGWIVASTTAAAVFAVITLPVVSWSGFRLRSPVVLTLLKYSWTLPFAAISTYIVSWIDSWVIRDINGIGSVGIYNWAYQVTAIASLAFAPIAVVLTPRVIDARLAGDLVKIKRYVNAILPAAVLLAIGLAFSFAFVFPALQLVAAPSYAKAYPVILVLLSALPFQLLGYLVTPLANSYERVLPRFVAISAVVAAVNVVGDLLLVPRIGILGAAISTAFAFAVGGLLQVAVVGTAGIAFAPIWRYSYPACAVVPALGAIYCWGAKDGGLVIGFVAVSVVSIMAGRRALMGSGQSQTAMTLLKKIESGLTLSGSC